MLPYSARFFSYTANLNRSSAQTIVPLIKELFTVSSVFDVGCANGMWLSTWKSAGIDDFLGIDGDYVDRSSLLIEDSRFVPRDVSQPFDMGRRFDLVQCLEVAEHLDAGRAAQFVDSLTAHGEVILFSAAPPGQGGKHHVNEQPYAYWRDLFAKRGYVMLDCVRPLLNGNAQVQPWYRYNCFVFVREQRFQTLSAELRATLVPAQGPVVDVAPPLYRLRRLLIRLLPYPVEQVLSVFMQH